MTDEELEKVARAATPGPWMAGADEGACWIESAQAGQTVTAWDDGITLPTDAEVADARFIAAFNPVTALALLERVRKAEALVARMQSKVGMLANAAYNLKQQDYIPEEHRRSLDEAQRAWDAVVREGQS